MGTGRALETDVFCPRRSCFSVSYGLPVSERSAAACGEKKSKEDETAEDDLRRKHGPPRTLPGVQGEDADGCTLRDGSEQHAPAMPTQRTGEDVAES